MIRRTIAPAQISVLRIVFTIFLIGGMLPAYSLAQSTENVQQAVDSPNDNAHKISVNSPSKSEQPASNSLKVTSDWDNFAPPRDDKFDWIQLTSGEWLKGELKVMYNFSLEFDSDELDLQKFDWEDIKQIRSAGYQSLRIEPKDGKGEPITVIGVLHLVDGKVRTTSGDQVLEFERERIVSIAKGSTKESDLWTGKISLGINIRSGNSDLVDSSFTANAKRRTAESRIIIDYIGNYSKAESVETSNNHRLNGYYDLFLTSKYFWRPVFSEYYRDRFKNINNQVTAGTAFGYSIIRMPKTEWEVSGGVGVLYKQFVSVEAGQNSDNTSPSLGLGTRYETDFTNWLEYLFDFKFQIVDKDSGTYIHHLITTLESDLISDLELDISFVWDRVQDPQPAADGTVPKKDDFQLIVGIGYEF
ncbi:DUF481 domain-containing protein [Kaarinaea lacus]